MPKLYGTSATKEKAPNVNWIKEDEQMKENQHVCRELFQDES